MIKGISLGRQFETSYCGSVQIDGGINNNLYFVEFMINHEPADLIIQMVDRWKERIK